MRWCLQYKEWNIFAVFFVLGNFFLERVIADADSLGILVVINTFSMYLNEICWLYFFLTVNVAIFVCKVSHAHQKPRYFGEFFNLCSTFWGLVKFSYLFFSRALTQESGVVFLLNFLTISSYNFSLFAD